jgi:hypothetical protein
MIGFAALPGAAISSGSLPILLVVLALRAKTTNSLNG